ncbi:MAG TPA: hypothetical protein VHG28_07855 [Longimicrobiaceae bacterium]|nr:hypothetical protein [Longimicrobiaceae bacterium]
MSAAADPAPPPPADAGWERLERAAEHAAAALAGWRDRALEAEAEVARLRAALDSVSREGGDASATGAELRALRAENALLLSRITEARRRVASLLARLAVLEGRR